MTFQAGDKIKTIYGEILTVMDQDGTTIWVYELNSTVHASKAWPA